MLAARPRSDVEELAGLVQQNRVPRTTRNDGGLAGNEIEHALRSFLFEMERNMPRYQEEELVAIGMHLAIVRSVPGHDRRTDGVAINPGGRASATRDDLCFAVAPQTQHGLR